MKEKEKKVLKVCILAGEIMLKNGAETYRVEDTIIQICKSYGIPLVETFVTPTGMFVCIDNTDGGGDTHTFIKRIKARGIDLAKISKTNNLSRSISKDKLSPDQAMEILKEIDATPIYSRLYRILSAGIIASFFTLMFDGSINDFLTSFFIGILVYILSQGFEIIQINAFIKTIMCGSFAAALAILCVNFNIGDSVNPIIIGSTMILLPGVAITNAIRDSISGEVLSGITRGAEAFITAISIAVGVGIVIKLWSLMSGGIY